MRIGIDLLGSESSPETLLEGVLQASKQISKKVELVVYSKKIPLSDPSIKQVVVSQEMTMDQSPTQAFRKQNDTSMSRALEDLARGEISALISAGSTGALLVGATLLLPKQIDRPALLALIPTETHPMAVLDVGGNVNTSSRRLVQFAELGAAVQKTLGAVSHPKVALLNIGTESIKGTENLKKAHQELSQRNSKHWDFVGNIEPRDAFQGKVDVLVTDGFAGNIFLKTCEGMSQLIESKLHLNEAFSQFDYKEYPGAILCGVEKLVIKCHGSSDGKTIARAILEAERLLEMDFIERLKDHLHFF